MSDTYTVRMKRKHIVTVYKTDGTQETTEDYLDVVFSDLPIATAEMYRREFPEAQVEIERMLRDTRRETARSWSKNDDVREFTRKAHAKAKSKAKAKPAPKVTVGGGSDMADLVNVMVERK